MLRIDSLIFNLIGFCQLLLSIYSFHMGWDRILHINLLTYWFVSLIYAYRGKQNTIVYFFFLISFFVFLLGADFLNKIFGLYSVYLVDFSHSTQCHIYFSLHLSLFFIGLGVALSRPSLSKPKLSINPEKRVLLTSIFKRFFNVTIWFKLIAVSISAYNTLKFSYVNLEAEKLSVMYPILKLGQISDISFFALLLLIQSRKELKTIVIKYLLIHVLSILSGVRGEFMYFLMYIFSFLFAKDYFSKIKGELDEVFFTRKKLFLAALILPTILVFMNLFAMIRVKEEVVSQGFTSDLVGFFLQQGGSSNMIGYAKDYYSSLPSTNISYTFGPLLEFFEPLMYDNYLKPDKLTYDAYYGNNLGATMTNIVLSNYYYSGGGFGTQYIAELYVDYGYEGIAFFSFVLGILMSIMIFGYQRNWMIAVICAFAIISFYSLPRNFYLNWLPRVLSIVNILFLFSINLYANKILKKRQVQGMIL